MLDPIGGFDRILDFFISYVETSFRISDRDVAKERRDLLLRPDVLATEPLIEPVLRYRTHRDKLEALIGSDILEPLSAEAQKAFVELALSGLFDGVDSDGDLKRSSRYEPYTHQVEMLKRGIRPGMPSIVTSGTGSGKTESFMLPILASLSAEAVSWAAPPAAYLNNCWWRPGSSFNERRSQRSGEDAARPAAVRALILYPMNALVADQMARLRKALDSDAARATMGRSFGGNRIFFGNYTGDTPVTGHLRHPRQAAEESEKRRRARRIARLREAMGIADRDQSAARVHDAAMRQKAIEEGRDPDDETRFIFPSVDGGEMISRWDMQAYPPDILVTNASMLGAMLSREVEDPIFEKTRRWIESDPGAYFYLVFDELHLIRGSAGTEVSFLAKSLLTRLGLDLPQHRHKLRILASSASMPMAGEDGERSRRYLRDLFAPFGTFVQGGEGSYDRDFWAGCVIEGHVQEPAGPFGILPPEPFKRLLESAGRGANLVRALQATSETAEAVESAARALGVPDGPVEEMAGALAEKAGEALAGACSTTGRSRATPASEIAAAIFGRADIGALRGLMLARAIPDSGAWKAKAQQRTPSFRIHTFVRKGCSERRIEAAAKLNSAT